jgi:hypothetical protein
MKSSEHEQAVGGDREPADADRPPVSRVGDELQKHTNEASSGRDDAEIEREAFEDAKEKGWDKPLDDT